MAGFLERFRKKIITSVGGEDNTVEVNQKEIDDKIALGVLLWVVAEADEKFLPQEETKIKEVLLTYSKIADKDLPMVLTSVRQAAEERIDLYRFTREIKENLNYDRRREIIKELFRVACADKELNDSELEVIRKIAYLFYISHKDFIEAKIEVKKEFGLDTAGF